MTEDRYKKIKNLTDNIENKKLNEQISNEKLDEFEQLRCHNTSNALLKSLANHFEDEFAAEYDQFHQRESDQRIPEELDCLFQDRIRDYKLKLQKEHHKA